MNETTPNMSMETVAATPETAAAGTPAVPAADDKPYTLRKLAATDLFLMSKIVGAIGFKEIKDSLDIGELKTLATGMDGNADDVAESLGISMFLSVADIVLSNVAKCENDLYIFLAGLSGMTAEDVKALPLATFAEMVVDVVQKEEFKDFFSVVSKLFK